MWQRYWQLKQCSAHLHLGVTPNAALRLELNFKNVWRCTSTIHRGLQSLSCRSCISLHSQTDQASTDLARHVCFQKLQGSCLGHDTGCLKPLTPNDHYSGCTAPLTSKRCILYINSTNICTEYFKHGIYSPFFSLQNAVCFIILTYLVPVLFTFYIQGVLNLKKK